MKERRRFHFDTELVTLVDGKIVLPTVGLHYPTDDSDSLTERQSYEAPLADYFENLYYADKDEFAKLYEALTDPKQKKAAKPFYDAYQKYLKKPL